jgi:hypothetical protein
MADEEFAADPIADEVSDADDIVKTDEDDAPETHEGEEFEYDLSMGGGA